MSIMQIKKVETIAKYNYNVHLKIGDAVSQNELKASISFFPEILPGEVYPFSSWIL